MEATAVRPRRSRRRRRRRRLLPLVILLADRSKFGSPAMARVVSWNRIDILIAAATPENREELRRIARLGVRVVPIGA